MPRDLGTCQFCKFIHHYKVERMAQYDFYQCRINPPIVIGDRDNNTSEWPAVAVDDWCGKWEP